MHLLNMRRSSTFCSLLNSFRASLGSSLSLESLDIKLKTFSPNTYYWMYNCTDKYSQGHPNTNPFTQGSKPNTTKCVQQRTKYLDTRFKNSSPVLEDFIHNLTEGRNSVHSRLPSLDKAFIGMLTRKSTGKEKFKATFNSLKSRSQSCSFPRRGAHLWISRDYLSHLQEKNGGEVENI